MLHSILAAISPSLLIAGAEVGNLYKWDANNTFWASVSVGLCVFCQVMGWFYLSALLRKNDWRLGWALAAAFLLQAVQFCLLLSAFHVGLFFSQFSTYSGMIPSLFEFPVLDHRIWVFVASIVLLFLGWAWTLTWLATIARQLPNKGIEALIHSLATNPIAFPLGMIVAISRHETVIMTESSAHTLFGQSPKRYGFASLIAVCLTFASWPLIVVIGFIMVYVAVFLALMAVVSGLLGVGSGVYYTEWGAVVAGAIGAGLAVTGACFIVSALSNFVPSM